MTTINWAELLQQAINAREFSYSPYSNYKVGAAILTTQGTIYTGCNIENAAYGPTVCAERTAIFKAVSEGQTNFVALAVVTANGATPCGVCRQVIREFVADIPVLVGDATGAYQIIPFSELLPHSFGPEKLA